MVKATANEIMGALGMATAGAAMQHFGGQALRNAQTRLAIARAGSQLGPTADAMRYVSRPLVSTAARSVAQWGAMVAQGQILTTLGGVVVAGAAGYAIGVEIACRGFGTDYYGS